MAKKSRTLFEVGCVVTGLKNGVHPWHLTESGEQSKVLAINLRFKLIQGTTLYESEPNENEKK